VTLGNAYNREDVRMDRWDRSREEIEPLRNWGFLPIVGFELNGGLFRINPTA